MNLRRMLVGGLPQSTDCSRRGSRSVSLVVPGKDETTTGQSKR